MSRRRMLSLRLSALVGSLALPIAAPANAAEVTFQRLVNADREPQNSYRIPTTARLSQPRAAS
jgi:hypothetical protein